jgi:hypothetical protein
MSYIDNNLIPGETVMYRACWRLSFERNAGNGRDPT